MSPKDKANTERLNVFFSSDVVTRLKEMAGKKGTSVSGLIRMIVLEYLSKQ